VVVGFAKSRSPGFHRVLGSFASCAFRISREVFLFLRHHQNYQGGTMGGWDWDNDDTMPDVPLGISARQRKLQKDVRRTLYYLLRDMKNGRKANPDKQRRRACQLTIMLVGLRRLMENDGKGK